MLFAIANHSGADFATTFKNAHYCGFVLSASLSDAATMFVSVHESGRAPNKGFVNFDGSAIATEFDERTRLHCQPNAMQHEPRGFLSDAKSAANFIGTDTVLAIGNHPNSDEPLV